MFYVYKNTFHDSEVIGQFTDADSASAYMEFRARNCNDLQCTGYAMRDFELKTCSELEK